MLGAGLNRDGTVNGDGTRFEFMDFVEAYRRRFCEDVDVAHVPNCSANLATVLTGQPFPPEEHSTGRSAETFLALYDLGQESP